MYFFKIQISPKTAHLIEFEFWKSRWNFQKAYSLLEALWLQIVRIVPFLKFQRKNLNLGEAANQVVKCSWVVRRPIIQVFSESILLKGAKFSLVIFDSVLSLIFPMKPLNSLSVLD